MNRCLRLFRDLATALLVLAAAAAPGQVPALLRGAGATFPAPLYARWAAEYERQTGVAVRYEPVGSGAGLDRVVARQVDFGATDVPLEAELLQRHGLLQFPATIGGVVPVLNIQGLRPGELRLTGEVLADIYLGRISRWNDPALAALNPTLKLPSAHITVVHRSEASGTTFLWSSYLAAASAPWRSAVGVGTTLAWPLGVGGTGNEGVASYVQRTRMSIGYVEYAYAQAHRLRTAALRNREGSYVRPSRETFEAAAASMRWEQSGDLVRGMIDAAGVASWPITGASFILLPARPDDAARSLEVLGFFDWALERGRTLATSLDYVALPESARSLIGQSWRAGLHGGSDTTVGPHRP